MIRKLSTDVSLTAEEDNYNFNVLQNEYNVAERQTATANLLNRHITNDNDIPFRSVIGTPDEVTEVREAY